MICLKKQVKELKVELLKKAEIIEKYDRNSKGIRIIEMEAEVDHYKGEMQRMRSMLQISTEMSQPY